MLSQAAVRTGDLTAGKACTYERFLEGDFRGGRSCTSRFAHFAAKWRLGREADFPNPFCVRTPTVMYTGAFGENLVCRRGHFPVGPARGGFAAGAAFANPLPCGNSSR